MTSDCHGVARRLTEQPGRRAAGLWNLNRRAEGHHCDSANARASQWSLAEARFLTEARFQSLCTGTGTQVDRELGPPGRRGQARSGLAAHRDVEGMTRKLGRNI